MLQRTAPPEADAVGDQDDAPLASFRPVPSRRSFRPCSVSPGPSASARIETPNQFAPLDQAEEVDASPLSSLPSTGEVAEWLHGLQPPTAGAMRAKRKLERLVGHAEALHRQLHGISSDGTLDIAEALAAPSAPQLVSMAGDAGKTTRRSSPYGRTPAATVDLLA